MSDHTSSITTGDVDVHPSAIVHRAAQLGRGVRVGPFAMIDANVTIGEGTTTEIGDRNFIMTGVHVGHNVLIGDDVVLTCGALLAGFVRIDDQANLSGNVGVHQFVRIGRLAMVGGVSMVRQDVPPFVLISGNPARANALNTVGLVRAGVDAPHRRALKRAFVLLYRSGLSVPTALTRIEGELGRDPYVQSMVAFIRDSQKRGIVRWAKEK